MSKRLVPLVALAMVGLAVACSGGGEPSRTATPGPSPSGTASAAPTMASTPTATQAALSPTQPAPLQEEASVSEVGLHLVEAATGRLWHLDGSAAWSPDGKRLVRWTCCPEQGGGLDVIYVPGGPGVRIFDGGADIAAWSPDGTQIAFSQWGEGPEGVYVVNSDGSALRQLSPRGTHAVEWSPAGNRLAFARDEVVYLLDIPSGEVTDVAQQAHDVAWSPDGATLAFSSDTGLYIYYPDTGVRRQIAAGPSGGPILWSPDGSRIVFRFGPRVPFAYPPEVAIQAPYVVEIRGGTEPKPLPMAADMSWSPDGNRIAYLEHGCITGNWDIYTVDPDGGSPVRLTTTPEAVKEGPYWAPTGTAIAISTFGELILLDAKSGEMQTLVVSGWPETTGRDVHLHGAVWSPDGRYIQFTVGTAHGICT